MSFCTIPIAMMLAAVFFVPVEARAQAVLADGSAIPPVGGAQVGGASTPAEAPAVLTLKERLGAKWRDEQRVDNCKVPVEKRGVKPRPEGCSHAVGK